MAPGRTGGRARPARRPVAVIAPSPRPRWEWRPRRLPVGEGGAARQLTSNPVGSAQRVHPYEAKSHSPSGRQRAALEAGGVGKRRGCANNQLPGDGLCLCWVTLHRPWSRLGLFPPPRPRGRAFRVPGDSGGGLGWHPAALGRAKAARRPGETTTRQEQAWSQLTAATCPARTVSLRRCASHPRSPPQPSDRLLCVPILQTRKLRRRGLCTLCKSLW